MCDPCLTCIHNKNQFLNYIQELNDEELLVLYSDNQEFKDWIEHYRPDLVRQHVTIHKK